MRVQHKLVKNGNSIQLTIPRQMLIALGWLAGQSVITELLEDGSLHVRLPRESDFAPMRAPRMIYDTPTSGGR
jgi:antitoxin component of MazEF toxin-antitoxin module